MKEKERKVVIIEGPEAALCRWRGTQEELDKLIAKAKAFDQAARENVLKRYNDLIAKKNKK